MSAMAVRSILACLLMLAGLAACSVAPPRFDDSDVTALTREIAALDPEVDPGEARRAAQIAFAYSQQLAQEYQVTDPPLVHNTKVNRGLRPRGLCWHWAEDMEKRLKQEDFSTLTLHRAIANADNPFRIDHSTAIISARGDGMRDGVVLDPWRHSGTLHWSSVAQDSRYDWQPRTRVLHEKAARRLARARR